jgi:peptide/nickel transport system substrate-binding protein
VLHSNGIESGGWNFSGWANDEFDALADEQQATLDQNQRRELVLEAQRIAFEEQAVTTYVSPNLAIGLNTRRFERPTQSVPGEGLLGMFTLTTIRPRGSKRVLALPQARNSFGTLNPIAVQEAEVNEFNRPIYDTLMRVGPEGRAVNWIISSLDVVNDTTVSVTLVDGLEWHDGEPVTADDVVFSFEYQTENKAPYVFSYLEPISSVESDGDRTVTFTLNGPYAPFQMLTLSLVPIIPQHIWAERENPTQERNIPPIGSGPFRFERLEEGSVLELSANKDHPQAPEIDGLLIQLFGNNSTAQQALLRGDIDGMWDVPATLQPDIEQSSDVELYFKPSHSIATLVHNTRRGMPFEDVAFRRAVATAIPNEGIVQQIYNGQATPGGSIISAANEFWHNSDLSHFTYDLEEARSILRDAGYSWDDDGNLLLPS